MDSAITVSISVSSQNSLEFTCDAWSHKVISVLLKLIFDDSHAQSGATELALSLVYWTVASNCMIKPRGHRVSIVLGLLDSCI